MQNKTILITGASRGMGRQIIENYAPNNDIIGLSRSGAGVEHERVSNLICDLSETETFGTNIDNILRQSPNIDVLINNAARGLERPRPAIDQKPKHLHNTMDVNLFGPWHAIQNAFPLMKENGDGVIINLLSPGSEHYMPNYSAVGISKAALSALTMYLSVELAPFGIRVNGVSAGWVEGSDGEHSYRKEVSERVKPFVPIGRNVSPEDVASAVAWMCSDESSMLVGHVLHIDGGFKHGTWKAILDD